jgi:HD-GYP domain-containing protein (c-di-GMP phosphodiesterase class II)
MAEKKSLLNTPLGLSMIVGPRDPYTGGHLWCVAQFSKLLAQHAGLSRRDIALCEIGGFLRVLDKPDRLSDS